MKKNVDSKKLEKSAEEVVEFFVKDLEKLAKSEQEKINLMREKQEAWDWIGSHKTTFAIILKNLSKDYTLFLDKISQKIPLKDLNNYHIQINKFKNYRFE